MRKRAWLLGVLAVFGLGQQARALYFVSHHGRQPMTETMARARGWPEGTLELADHGLREDAWHPVWSGHANDVLHFGYRPKGLVETNELLARLAAIRGPKRVILCPEKAARGEGKGFTATFSLGSQKTLDEWFDVLPGKRFGPRVLAEPPTALPPTLNLYLGGLDVEPARLRIRRGMQVVSGVSPQYRKQQPADPLIDAIDRLISTRQVDPWPTGAAARDRSSASS